jgi:hypothetical protein
LQPSDNATLQEASGERPERADDSNSGTAVSLASVDRELERPRVDKSVLAIAEPKRTRDAAHLRYVADQPCLICARQPAEAHHLRFAQPRAIGSKVSDAFTVPLCALHHRELHARGNEKAWWSDRGRDPLLTANQLWAATRDRSRENSDTPMVVE